MSLLAITLPGGPNGGSVQINPPAGIPQGGIAVTSKVIGNATSIMLILTVILSLIFLIVGGMQWIQSGGDKQKVAGARARITYAIIGLVIALVSFFIVNVVGLVFNVKLF